MVSCDKMSAITHVCITPYLISQWLVLLSIYKFLWNAK